MDSEPLNENNVFFSGLVRTMQGGASHSVESVGLAEEQVSQEVDLTHTHPTSFPVFCSIGTVSLQNRRDSIVKVCVLHGRGARVGCAAVGLLGSRDI